MDNKMDNKKLKYYKNRLLQEREKILKSLKFNEERENEISKFQDRELSSYDNHPADMGTEVYMMEQDIGFQEHYKQVLEEIDISLKDIESGEYGYCFDCDEMISDERLELIPYAKTCLKCSDEDKKPIVDDRDSKPKKYESLGYSKDPKEENLGYYQDDINREIMEDDIVPKDPSHSTGDNMGLIDPDESDDIE